MPFSWKHFLSVKNTFTEFQQALHFYNVGSIWKCIISCHPVWLWTFLGILLKRFFFFFFYPQSNWQRGGKKIKFGCEIMGVEIFSKREYHTPFFNAHVCPKADIWLKMLLQLLLYRYIAAVSFNSLSYLKVVWH